MQLSSKTSNVLNALVSSEQIHFKQTSETVCTDGQVLETWTSVWVSVSVHPSVPLVYYLSNALHRNFIFGMQIHLQNTEVKIHQGRLLKVMVTGTNKQPWLDTHIRGWSAVDWKATLWIIYFWKVKYLNNSNLYKSKFFSSCLEYGNYKCLTNDAFTVWLHAMQLTVLHRNSVHLSVHLSQVWIVTIPNNALQIFWYHMKGQSLCYSDTRSGWWAMPPSL